MAREGVFKRTGLDIPLARINSVRFEHSLLDRVLGCGTLIIESASDEPLEFDDIPPSRRCTRCCTARSTTTRTTTTALEWC